MRKTHSNRSPVLDTPVTPTPRGQGFAFSGRGFLPDFFSESAFAQLNEAQKTNLELGVVVGKDGMLAPGGTGLGVIDKGKRSIEGESGGAGSFYTIPSFRAKG